MSGAIHVVKVRSETIRNYNSAGADLKAKAPVEAELEGAASVKAPRAAAAGE